MELAFAIAALVTAAAAIVIQNTRHARVRRRLTRLERRDAELLGLLKATAARRAHTGDPGSPPVLRAEFGEDLLCLELFGWKPNGYYIEVGAYDGERYAITAAMDTLGWHGLLIAPVPDLCDRARANRPNARVVNAAVSKKGSAGTATMTHILPGDPDADTQSANAPDASSHLNTSSGNLATNRPPAGNERTIEVPLTTIDDLLRDHSGPIDLASIDVEGHELDLLDGFDLDRFRPAAILIEDHAMRDESPVAAHLRGRGYTHTAWFAWNRLFVRTDQPTLIARAREILQHLEHPPSR